MFIKSDVKHRQQYQKWLFTVKQIKQNGNWLYFNFSVESLSFKLNNFKTNNLRLPLKVEIDQFVFRLALLECLCVKICCISPSHSETNHHDTDAESPFPLFFSFSASFKNSAQEKRLENCLRFGTGGLSLCLYPLLSRNIIFCPALITMAAG